MTTPRTLKGDTTLAELVRQMKPLDEPVSIRLDDYRNGYLVLVPEDDYDLLRGAVAAHRQRKERPRRTPFELFAETVHRLRELERKHGMSSAEFYEGFQSGRIPEGSLDYFDWRVEYDSYLRMKERFGFSEGQVADAER